jgi:HEAT repeat protein
MRFTAAKGIVWGCRAWTWIALGIAGLAPALAAGPAGAPPIDGLDSLASVTLLRALDYLEITPAELGFEKLYADDDTFRLTIVEELLNDPLEVPGWQKAAVGGARVCVTDPVALVGYLGETVEAPERPRDAKSDARAGGTMHAWFGDPNARAAGTDRRGAVDRFVAATREAESALDAAFARVTPEERQMLLIVAPSFWGEAGDPVDKVRKGALHRELGAPADTAFEPKLDKVLDLAVKLDRPEMTRAASLFLAAVAELAAALDPPSGSAPAVTTLEGVTGPIAASFDTPWGLLVIGGPGANLYSEAALRRIAFLFEPGGDDRYQGRAASAVGTLLRPFGALVDYDGNDVYEASDCDYVLGGAILGVAALVDAGGNDTYRGRDGSLGGGFFGVGFLYDGAGVDFFEGGNLCEGSGAFGLGALVSWASPDAPPGAELDPDRAYEAHLVKVPGTGAVPVRADENDIYVCRRQSQGFASTFGAGLLFDQAGSDTYRAGGFYRHSPLLPNDFQALSQGFSIGFRPRAAGGVGILIDESGNDFYAAEVYAQGTSYWYSIGFLFDGAGNDEYIATQYAQGAGVHLSVGTLWDQGGNDHYLAHLGVTQGTAHDLSVGWLIDESGNDYYVVSDGQGMSITNSTGIFIDGQGDDLYAVPGVGQGCVTWARGFCGAGIFLDLEGKDTYPRSQPGRDGAVWSADFNAIGIDLDRNLQLPGEVVPPITLTAADSARTVEELFKTASIWEVGSAREKVARARQALMTKGVAAVDYAIANKLSTTDGLEYRVLEQLAEAYPDSFAARLLPHLGDVKEVVRRNVIGLIGTLKWKPARGPLERVLADDGQAKLASRVIATLGLIGDPAARPAVRPYLRDTGERRRLAAIGAVAALKDTLALPVLAERLSDPLLTVRSAAASALIGFREVAVDPICAGLAAGEDQRAVRLRTLGRIAVALRDSTSATALKARSRARRALMDALDAPLAETLPDARAAAVEGLVGLGDDETLAFVRLRMQDEYDPWVKRAFEVAEEKIGSR